MRPLTHRTRECGTLEILTLTDMFDITVYLGCKDVYAGLSFRLGDARSGSASPGKSRLVSPGRLA